MNVTSPLTGSQNVILETCIDVAEIKEGYQKHFGMNVEELFKGLTTVQLYKCLDTHYRFYYPYYISGNAGFYEQLQQFDWYYMDWKWEHEASTKYIKQGDKILEVGCAKGSFIEKLSKKGTEVTGLELNASAASEGRNRGLNILTESIEQHSLHSSGIYDIVCSFQVMEHIAHVKEMLASSIKVLKPGGKLIVSVPNNDSFLGLDKNYLNMPPHHMGLWNKRSLLNLNNVFNLKLIDIQLEPLQPYHKAYFSQTMANYYLKKYAFLPEIIKKIVLRIIPKLTGLFSKEIKGYTIQVVYEKI